MEDARDPKPFIIAAAAVPFSPFMTGSPAVVACEDTSDNASAPRPEPEKDGGGGEANADPGAASAFFFCSVARPMPKRGPLRAATAAAEAAAALEAADVKVVDEAVGVIKEDAVGVEARGEASGVANGAIREELTDKLGGGRILSDNGRSEDDFDAEAENVGSVPSNAAAAPGTIEGCLGVANKEATDVL